MMMDGLNWRRPFVAPYLRSAIYLCPLFIYAPIYAIHPLFIYAIYLCPLFMLLVAPYLRYANLRLKAAPH